VPGTAKPDLQGSGVPEMEEHILQTADGLKLLSWYMPAKDNKFTIMYFQGNAGTIGSRGFKARHFLNGGYGLLMVGYRGYGGNPGNPSEDGLILDGKAGLSFLKEVGVNIDDIVLYGESLGSGVAVALAAGPAKKAAALILESPYSSIQDIAASRYWFAPTRLLLKDKFDSIARIRKVQSAVLILHGEGDGIIPVEHGARLFQQANEPKHLHLFSHGGHSDLYDHGANEVILKFLDGL